MFSSPQVSLDELCKKAVEQSLASGRVTQLLLNRATVLASSYDTAWKKLDLLRRLDNNLEAAKASLQRSQLHMVMFQVLFGQLLETLSRFLFFIFSLDVMCCGLCSQWQHEDVLSPNNQPISLSIPPRSIILSNMKKKLYRLSQDEGAVVSIQVRRSSVHHPATRDSPLPRNDY